MKITYVSGTRADYGLMRSILFRLREEKDIDLSILVTGMHLREEFGFTFRDIEKDGFSIFSKIDTLHRGDSLSDMTRSVGETIVQFSDVLAANRPDLLLLLGDRDEQLAGAICASHLNIASAQVHAGERTGSVDESNRHAISRFAHILFASNEDSRERLLKMGEEPFRIHCVGAPALDHFAALSFLSRPELSMELKVELGSEPFVVLLQHSNTTEYEASGPQIVESVEAIRQSGLKCIAFTPNSDSGGAAILQELKKRENKGQLTLLTHLKQDLFASLLKESLALVGNSSCGIIECSFLNVPAVNIGTRQVGRFQGRNVINVDHDRKNIARAIERIKTDSDFKTQMAKDRFIYGDGHAADKVLKALRSFSWNDIRLIQKRVVY